MSVQTTADEHRDAARENVRDAIRNLSQIVVEQCWGHDEYRAGYRTALSESFQELIAIQEKLR